MQNLSLHKASANQLAAASQALPQALLLAGPTGVGLKTIAQEITKPLTKHLLVIEPDDKGTIGIEVVRELYTKTRSKQTEQQIIVIDDAEAMSTAAQNAFLKLLEEPTEKTSFLLTSHSPDRLLSTIRSRVQLVNIQPLTPSQTEQHLDALEVADSKKRQQLTFIAVGLPAELFRLTQGEDYFSEQADLARKAREFLSSKQYNRLLIAHQIGASRDQAVQLLDHVVRILKYSLENSAKRSLALQLDQALQTAESIRSNGHVRTQLLKLALSL